MYPIADMHCDTISCKITATDGAVRLAQNSGHIDLNKLKIGGSLLECFAIYIPAEDSQDNPHHLGAYGFYHAALADFKREMEENRDTIGQVSCCADIEHNRAAGKLCALLSVEDGMPIDGKIERVDEMYGDGVRMVALTWNYENSIGYPNRWPETSMQGLKPFGIETVRRMNELGMIVDVSHLSDGGFYDVVKYCTKPFVASHSNARAQCDVVRNLSDDMLKLIGDAGGVIGLNFCAGFLVKGREDKAYTADIVRHARHIADKAGVETLGFGSDFDGIGNDLEFTDASGMQQVMQALERCFTPRELELISHKNVLRVIADNCG
ncbi:MAG: membrane dipeptidase [Clostridia bacterium]